MNGALRTSAARMDEITASPAPVPSEPVDWAAELTLTGLAVVVSVAAWFAYRRRDIG